MHAPIDRTLTPTDVSRPTRVLGHPDDVLQDPGITPDDKRALLADWASDAHAIENAPALRQLDDGSVVPVDDILRALTSLESTADFGRDIRRAAARRRSTLLSRLRGIHLRSDDDNDDPPPCPASAALPLRLRRTVAVAA